MIPARQRQRLWFATACGVVVLLSGNTASAHSPIEGLGAFYSHALHPYIVLPHLLSIVAVGLFMGQNGRFVARAGVAAFSLALAGGLCLTFVWPAAGARAELLLASALVLAVPVAAQVRVPAALVAAAAAATGLLVGMDSSINARPAFDRTVGAAGMAAGILYLLILVAGGTTGLTREYQRIGIRVIGSWVFAIALVSLTLAFRKGGLTALSSPLAPLAFAA